LGDEVDGDGDFLIVGKTLDSPLLEQRLLRAALRGDRLRLQRQIVGQRNVGPGGRRRAGGIEGCVVDLRRIVCRVEWNRGLAREGEERNRERGCAAEQHRAAFLRGVWGYCASAYVLRDLPLCQGGDDRMAEEAM